MAIYSVGRRRIIFAVILTCILLLVLDRQGNPVVDRLRDVAAIVMRPVDTAAEVVTNPVVRAWRSYAEYDDLQDENQALREEVDRLRGTQAAAQAAVRDYAELAALAELPSLAGIETVVAQVVGRSATNLDEIVEINKGSLAGIAVGMPVVNQAGLVGKVTSVSPTTARIRLVTDRQYSIPVEILVGSALPEEEPVTTSPSGLTPRQIEDLTTTTTTLAGPSTTIVTDVIDTGSTLPGGPVSSDAVAVDPLTGQPLPADSVPADSVPAAADPADSVPAGADPAVSTSTTTTTVPFETQEKEFGVLTGNGGGRVPQIRFVQDYPALSVLQLGDLVVTAGGSTSFAPTGIPIGHVVNRVDRPGVSGPLLEVELNADVDRLNFVQIVLYRPLSEVGS